MLYSNEHINFLKKKKKKKFLIAITQILIFITFIIIWELLAKYKIINTFLTSSPSLIFKTIINLAKDNNLFNNIKALGTAVFDKSYDELAKLLGDNVPTNQTSASAINRPVVNEPQPASNAAMPNTFTNNYTNMNETSMFNRPKRLYSNE